MKKQTKKLLVGIAMIMLMMTVLCFSASAKECNVGDIVQFGSYPQSKVTDEAILANLNKLAPVWENWTSYGYYSGNGEIGSMVAGDWMRYTDIVFEGEKYRGVKFTQYRMDRTYCFYNGSYQLDNNYKTDTYYWFKFEPLNWRVLNPDTGLVLCESIIDSQAYSNTVYCDYDNDWKNFNDPLFVNFASDYETSSIREWLNDDFYNTAFTEEEKSEINTTTLNNNCYDNILGYGNFIYDSEETNDRVFLLSLDEATNSDYGFLSLDIDMDPAREAQGSDYAKCQGLGVLDSRYDPEYNGNSQWLLRTPTGHYWSCGVDEWGRYGNAFDVWDTYVGVRPALCFTDISDINNPNHKHSYAASVTSPTCTEQGYTTYTCDCTYSYIADYVVALGHKDENGDYKCDNGCGYEYKKPAPSDPSEDCSCNCHKSGFMGFIWKILRIFYKIFKTNPVCACSAAHY